MITGTEPNPSAPGNPQADLPAGARVAGDVVMGDKNVAMTAGGDIVLGNKITNISNVYQAPSWGEARFGRNRQAMIQNVREIWVKGVLDDSLYGDVLIQLGLEHKPEAVEQPWNLEPAARMVPANARKIDLFDQANGALLILGQPGAGKTTTLLELARDLLERAEQNPTAPVPVIFSLASWAEKHLPLAQWLVEELFRRYDVPRQLGRAWVEQDMLIPLLDGLDEVHLEHAEQGEHGERREACVQAINAFRADHGLAPLVVCSRIVDYEALGTRLRLRDALVVQPLTPEQVDAHLAQFGEKHALLRSAVQQRDELRELARTPLMLGVMMVVYQGQAGEIALKGSPADQRTYLFSQYVARMLERADELRVYRGGPEPGAAQPDRSPYPDKQTVHWLSWLARTMRRHGQTLLYLESMQPDWLPTPAQAALVTLGTSTLAGLGVSLVYGLLTLITSGPFQGGFFVDLVAGLTGGLAGGLFAQCASDLRSHERPPAARPWLSAAAALVVLLGGGLVIAGIATVFGGTDSEVLNGVFLIAWIVTLIGGFTGYSRTIATVERLHWARHGWRTGVAGMFIGGTLAALLGGVLTALVTAALTVGDVVGTDGLALALLEASLVGWLAGLFGGVLFWHFGALIGGWIGSLRGSFITAPLATRRAVNEGIWRSARSALMGVLIGGVSATLVAGLLGLGLEVTNGVTEKWFFDLLAFVLIFGPSFAVIGAIAYGGKAVIQHILLRTLLWRNGSTPRPGDYPRFLDYAADRVLLRKAGGGYIFVHPLLIDYLAGLDA